MKRLLISISLFVCFTAAKGQSDPIYGQYMFNPLLINPAYAGLHDMASFYGVYRSQWTGIEGLHPETFSLSGQSTLPQNKIGVGFSYVYDQFGYTKTHEVNALTSYKLDFGSKSLSFGLQVGGVRVEYDYSMVTLKEDDVEFLDSAIGAGTAPSIGLGMLYSSRTMFFGASVPNMLGVEIEDGSSAGTQIYKNYMLTGGYVFHFKNKIKIKPSVLLRWNRGVALVYDINCSVLFNDIFWGGISLRSFNTLILMTQIKVSDYLTCGASYEIPVDGKHISQLGNTFELLLNCNLSIFDIQAVQTIFY